MNAKLFKPLMERLKEIGAQPNDLELIQWGLFFERGWRLQIEYDERENGTEKTIRLIPPRK